MPEIASPCPAVVTAPLFGAIQAEDFQLAPTETALLDELTAAIADSPRDFPWQPIERGLYEVTKKEGGSKRS